MADVREGREEALGTTETGEGRSRWRARGGAVEADATAARITALEREFRELSKRVPGLEVEVVGRPAADESLVHPTAGFEVRLEPGGVGAGVSLYVSSAYGELKRWRRNDGIEGAARERFAVSLMDGFGWGESIFPDAGGLANDLLGYMQFNLDVAADDD
jgi:hypothetical protein